MRGQGSSLSALTCALCFTFATAGFSSGDQQRAQSGQTDGGCHVVSGWVVDQSGAPLAGVEVLTDQGESNVTDETGRFELCTRVADLLPARFRRDGYGSVERSLDVRSGEKVTVTLTKEQLPQFEGQVTVVGQAERTVEPAREMEPASVIALPGAGEDALQALRAVPGVVSVDDWSSRLYVRGGRPDQNGIYLDGIAIYDPYRLFGLTSLFNPETLESIALYPGGFDVQYGDRLSAVIAVENRDGSTERPLAGSANLSLTNTNVVAEGRFSEQHPSSWMVSARRTYYDLIVSQTGETQSEFPSFTDAQARLLFEPSPGHRFTVTLLGYDESTDLAEDEEPQFGEVDDRIEAVDDQKGYVAGLRGQHRLGRRLHLDYVLAATRNEQSSDLFFREGETGFESTFVQDLTGDVLSLRSTLGCDLGGHDLQLGVEAAQSDNVVSFHIRTEDPRIPIPDDLLDFEEGEDFRRYAGFLQDTWQVTPKLTLKGGVRWDRSTLAGADSVSPRVSLRFEPAPSWDLRAAWGNYTQFANYESLQGDGYFLDLRGIKDLGLEPERAVHWLLGGGHTSELGYRVTLDLYRKDLNDILQSGEEAETILVLDDNDEARPYTRDIDTFVPENARSGYSQGAELAVTLLERSDRPFYGMAAYTFGQARTRDSKGWLWEPWDQRHAFSVMGGWRFSPSWEIGMRWRYATGFPYTPVTNVIRVVEDVNGDGRYDPEAGDWITYQRDEPQEVRRSGRLPSYHRLDLRVEYSPSFDAVDAVFYLDIINAYFRDNVIEYTYNQDYTERDAVTGMPFVPSVGLKIAF